MKQIPSGDIMTALSVLNDATIDLRLLRNIDNELPERLASGKDIDILIRWQDRKIVELLLKQNGFQKIPHPLLKDQFLYGVHPFRFFKSRRSYFFIDFQFELACRSLNQGEWIPLDRVIQETAWESVSYHRIGEMDIPGLPLVCEWIHLLTRCIFDKQRFDGGYTRRIERLTFQNSDVELYEVSRLVFFKFAEPLLNLIKAGKYDQIISQHLSFKDY